MLQAKNTNKTLLFPFQMEDADDEDADDEDAQMLSLCSSPGCEGEVYRAMQHETEVEGIGMCRVAGGFS